MAKRQKQSASKKATKPDSILEPEILMEIEEAADLERLVSDDCELAAEDESLIDADEPADEVDMSALQDEAEAARQANQDDILKTEGLLDTTEEQIESQTEAEAGVDGLVLEDEEYVQISENEQVAMQDLDETELNEEDLTIESPEAGIEPEKAEKSEIQISLTSRNTSEEIPQFIDKLLENRCHDLVLDGSQVERIDTNFVEALISAQKLWSNDGYSICYSNVSDALQSNLNLIGIPLSKLEV